MCHKIFRKLFSLECLINFADVVIAACGLFYSYDSVKILIDHHKQWQSSYIQVDYIDIPPVVLIVLGILTFILRIYLCNKLWKSKNRRYLSYLIWIQFMIIISALSMYWLMTMENKITEMLDTRIRKSLSAHRITTDISSSNNANNPVYNSADIKLTCCGYNETARPGLEEVASIFCCIFDGLENTTRSTCISLYERDCYNLALSHTRNDIINLTRLTTLWILIMVLTLLAVLQGIYRVFNSRSKHKRQIYSDLMPIRISGPHQPPYAPTAPPVGY